MNIEIFKVKDVSLKDIPVSPFDSFSVFEKFNHKFDEIFKDTYVYSSASGMPLVLTPLQRIVMTPEIMTYINKVATCVPSSHFKENDEIIEKSISFDNWVRDVVFVNGDGKYEKIPISHVVMNMVTKLRIVENTNGFGPNANVLADTEIFVSINYDKDRTSSTIFDSFIDMIYD